MLFPILPSHLLLSLPPNLTHLTIHCGDYTFINLFILFMQKNYIPNVLHEFNFFLDFDMKNAFHQILLAEHTSNNLSVLTVALYNLLILRMENTSIMVSWRLFERIRLVYCQQSTGQKQKEKGMAADSSFI